MKSQEQNLNHSQPMTMQSLQMDRQYESNIEEETPSMIQANVNLESQRGPNITIEGDFFTNHGEFSIGSVQHIYNPPVNDKKSSQNSLPSQKSMQPQKSKPQPQSKQQKKQSVIKRPSQKLIQKEKKKEKQTIDVRLKHNKYLKQTFIYFCNISYAEPKTKTFDEMQEKRETLSLHRFMIFCKEFNLYQILKHELSGKLEGTQTNSISMSDSKSSYLKNDFNKQNLAGNPSQSRLQKSMSNSKMLQIPVKEVVRLQKTLSTIFKSHTIKSQPLTYQNFLMIIMEIFSTFKKNITKIYPDNIIPFTENEIQEKFLENVLCIKTAEKHREKMNNLKVEFKGAISYHHEPKAKKFQKVEKKDLVLHGGRSSEEMKKELQVYQENKGKKTESWINSQPSMTGLYSKSRIFYKPNPSRIYQTNDVIRLARHEANRTHTESLFDFGTQTGHPQPQPTQFHKQQLITFSKIFEDRSNTFAQKLDKLKDHYNKKDLNMKLKKLQDNDDLILKEYFESQKKTYGDETIGHNLIN